MRIRVTVLFLFVLLSACATDASRLCDGRLSPINVPAVVTQSADAESRDEKPIE